jgi:putative oxidoreductase
MRNPNADSGIRTTLITEEPRVEFGSGDELFATIIAVFVPLAFLGAGLAQMAGTPMHADNYVRWGYPLSLMTSVGVAEVALAVGAAFRRSRFFASIGLAAIMLGAVATHVVAGELTMLTGPALLLALAVTNAWLHRSWR